MISKTLQSQKHQRILLLNEILTFINILIYQKAEIIYGE